MKNAIAILFALSAGIAAAYPVVRPGEAVSFDTAGCGSETNAITSYKIFANVRELPAAFARLHEGEIQHRSNRYWDTLIVKKSVPCAGLPPKVELDTTGYPAGDYLVCLQWEEAPKAGNRLYPAKTFGFAVREAASAAKIAPAGKVPFIAGFGGDPKGAAAADVPWMSDFNLTGATGKSANPTAWKMFHDGEWIYVAVRCGQPKGMARVRAMKRLGDNRTAIERDNSLEFNFDPSGRGLRYYKLIVSATGDKIGYFAEDDNTGNDRYVFSQTWADGARVRSSVGESDWTIELAISVGAFEDVRAEDDAEWGISVGRFAYAPDEKVYEHSVSAPATSMAKAKTFGRFAFAGATRFGGCWELAGLAAKARPQDGKLALDVSLSAVNRGEAFRLARVRTTARDVNGAELGSAEADVSATAGRGTDVKMTVPGLKPGDATLFVELLSPEGRLEKQIVKDVPVEYQPVKIRLTEPCYRDCVFETMKLKRIAGTVTLEDGVGAPLEIRLDGPDTHECVKIASAAAVNGFEFPFAGKAKGDYWLTAGKARKRLRNLPYHPGEVWFDKDNVIYRDGRKFLLFQWSAEDFRSVGFGVTGGGNTWQNGVELVPEICRIAESNGCVRILRSFHPDPGCKNRDEIFSYKLMAGEFGAPGKIGDRQRASVRAMVEKALASPAFFSYELADEPEGWGINPIFLEAAREMFAELDPYHPTLVSHYSDDGVERFRRGSDIKSPDIYPVYFEDGTTRDLKRVSYDKVKTGAKYGPVFTTIQGFDWWAEIPGRPVTRGPTYDELREQILLGFAGDAKGICVYSKAYGSLPSYHMQVGADYCLREVYEALDAFLAPSADVKATLEPVKANVISALKRSGDDALLIVVNTDRAEAKAVFEDARLPKTLYLTDAAEPVSVRDGRLALTLAPYESRVYRSKPWTFSYAAAKADVERREASRRKPGNLCAPKKFLTVLEMERILKGKAEQPFPRMVASSCDEGLHTPTYTPFFAQDGFDDEYPYSWFHAWAPTWPDRKKGDPWLRVEFGEKKTVSRVVLTRCRTEDGRYSIDSGWFEANGRKIAAFEKAAPGKVELVFPPVRTDSITFHPGPYLGAGSQCCYVAEFEAYEK